MTIHLQPFSWQAELERYSGPNLKLTGTTKAGRRGRCKWLSRKWKAGGRSQCRQGIAGIAKDTDRVDTKVLIGRPSCIEGLDRQG